MIEQSFQGSLTGETPVSAAKWTLFGLLNLVLLAAAILAIVLLVKLVF
jgi:hypothetical protein